MGNKLWNTDGLLISDNSQNSSLVDWAIASDNQDNAILTFTDTRNNDSLHAFAYLIDPSGNFLWGNNGIRLSGDGDYQPNPVTTQTSDGNYVFTWIVATTPQKIAMQKISFAGQKMWGANPIIYESGTTENYTYPAIVPSDNGSVIIEHSGYTGGFTAPYKIYAQKFDTNGNPVWGTGGVSIQNTGIPFYEHPLVISDNNNGAFISWYDDRDNNSFFSAFVQHVTSSGRYYFRLMVLRFQLQLLCIIYIPQWLIYPTQMNYSVSGLKNLLCKISLLFTDKNLMQQEQDNGQPVV